MLKLPEKVLAMLRDGKLSVGHAKALMGHADPEQGAREVVKKDLSVRETEDLVNNLTRTFKGRLLNRPPPELTRTADTDALAESMSEKLGVRVRITFNGRSGSVTLNYATLDQLDSILALLNG
jgi:ParB family chromosome partitioning protein